MNLRNINRVHFIGIGGIGMSALARFFLFNNKEVTGYDKVATNLTKELEKEGAIVSYVDEIDLSLNEASINS